MSDHDLSDRVTIGRPATYVFVREFLCAAISTVHIVFLDASILVRKDRSLRSTHVYPQLGSDDSAARAKKIVACVERFVQDAKAEGKSVETT